jgi:hypothetical protein
VLILWKNGRKPEETQSNPGKSRSFTGERSAKKTAFISVQ